MKVPFPPEVVEDMKLTCALTPCHCCEYAVVCVHNANHTFPTPMDWESETSNPNFQQE